MLATKNKPKPEQVQRRRVFFRGKEIIPTNTPFLELPREIREMIYFWTLRPDCGLGGHLCKSHQCIQNGLGTTKILSLNRQILSETIGLLQSHERCISINGEGRQVFRYMRAFGKPAFFWGSARTSQCFVPPPFCELQIVRMKYLALNVSYPLPQQGVRRMGYWNGSVIRRSFGYEDHMAKLTKEAREVETVLWKCRELQTFRLRLQTEHTQQVLQSDVGGRDSYVALTDENHIDAQKILEMFLSVAACKHFKTTAEVDNVFEVHLNEGIRCTIITAYRDPLVHWYNGRAQELGVFVHLENLEESRITFPHEVHVPPRYPDLPHTSYDESPPGSLPRPQAKMYLNKDVSKPWSLHPECKKCYALFASWEGLQHHLEEKPSHRVPFRRKAYNVLSRFASHEGARKCWTCARSFMGLEALGKHLDKYRHRREGMVPRWTEDNAWANRLDAERKKRRREKFNANGLC